MNTSSEVSSEDVIKVSVYILTSLMEFIPYVIILWIIQKDKKTYDSPVFLIIFHLGIADCIQLVLHCTALPFTLLRTPIKDLSIKICGGFLNGIYHAMIPLTLLLAFNRFITLCFNESTEKWFNQKLLKPCIAFAWLWSCGAIAIFLSPITGVLYDFHTLTWGYSTDDLFAYGPTVELCVTSFQNILGAIFYLITIINLTIMAVIIGIYGCLNCAYWNFFYYYLDISYSAFLGNWLWIVQNGMNPFLYLTMNERIRKSFIKCLSCKTKVHPRAIIITTQSSQPRPSASSRNINY